MRRFAGAVPGANFVVVSAGCVSRDMQALFYRVGLKWTCRRAYSEAMTRTVSEEEFAKSQSELLKSVGRHSVIIQKNGETLGVLVSAEQYETTHEAKAERAIKAMHEFAKHMQSVTTPEELDELEKELHASTR
jgi:PHD/YefM family antitoxin component YafN of YafNO toxin-antitoxin module